MAESYVTDINSSKSSRGYFSIWAAAVPMVTISVITISSNGAILSMFVCRQGLRRCKNLYFFSLALADFLVGLSMIYKLTKDLYHTWDTGWSCKVYQTVKQSLVYASFLSIFLITVDKWRAIHYPVSYRKRSTKYINIAAVIFVWLISFCIFTLPQIWWDNFIQITAHDISPWLKSAGFGTNLKPHESSMVHSSVIADQNSSINNIYHIQAGNHQRTLAVCPEGYNLNVKLSIFSTTLFYVCPLLAMLVFVVTLYLKLKWRKSVEVQRSTSVTDTYFMTLKKPASDIPESCITATGDDDSTKESLLKNSEPKLINKHLAIGSRGERRHSSLPSISPILKGRTSSGRRVSMPESNSGGGCRYVGRKWSGCTSALGPNQNQPPNPMANLAPRLHNEDMVHDLLVKQDRTTVNCLCLMLAALLICWLPHAVVSIINSRCWCLFGTTITITSWFFHLDHAINPFLYGLMYVQFINVLKQWLLIERVHAFKMRDTLILKNIQRKIDCEESSKQRSPNPQTKDKQFDVPHLAPHFDMANEDLDNISL
ncbi:unnamed protein product [Candidula unifasciata]|uniref:G-protein coupled receptors family 1 profile domain-containing protein n=1 Tax=Candidula unifasciata TaxID=100452 RepID=A0A8S3ZPB8_9EUPU|nr:unnamed protein product [Candidula unifasciata]